MSHDQLLALADLLSRGLLNLTGGQPEGPRRDAFQRNLVCDLLSALDTGIENETDDAVREFGKVFRDQVELVAL